MDRYLKQINLSKFGTRAQKMLLSSKVLIVGAGGLGSKISEVLCRSGIGEISILDFDKVALSNLQRQSLYDESDISKYKSQALSIKLRKINSNIKINCIIEKLESSNISNIIKEFDLVIDALDNLETRFLINDYCLKNKVPWVYSGIINYEGQCLLIKPSITPCLECFINKNNNSFFEPGINTGIYYPSVIAVASISANLAIKYLAGLDIEWSTLYKIDFFNMDLKKIKLKPNIECNICKRYL